jgi:hypothetical protein
MLVDLLYDLFPTISPFSIFFAILVKICWEHKLSRFLSFKGEWPRSWTYLSRTSADVCNILAARRQEIYI